VLINTHVLDAAVDVGIEYVFVMGTGCAYPKRLEGQVLYEEDYLDGVPEATNDAYAYAKRGMLVHVEALREEGVLDYCYCLPANIYGPHDNFHPEHSHVVAGLTRRFVEAGDDEVTIWGTGRPSDTSSTVTMLSVMKQAAVVLTDSGGIQEETTVLGVPCLTVRPNTERPITTSEGTNRLVADRSRESIQAAFAEAVQQPRRPCRSEGWDGRTAPRIVDALEAWAMS
jgi:hypothetical protein